MPSPTYVALAKTVLTGNQATITFSAIPGTYTDLCLVVSARTDRASQYNDEIAIKLNSSGGGSYSQTGIYGLNATVYNVARTTANAQLIRYNYTSASTATSNTFGSLEIYIPNYAGTTQKPISTTYAAENNSSTQWFVGANAALGNVTSAITSIELTSFNAANFVSGSRFDLYGIKNS